MFTIETAHREYNIDPSEIVAMAGDWRLTELVDMEKGMTRDGEGEYWALETEDGGYVLTLYGPTAMAFCEKSAQPLVYVYLCEDGAGYGPDEVEFTHDGRWWVPLEDPGPCCRAMVTAPGEHEVDCPWQ